VEEFLEVVDLWGWWWWWRRRKIKACVCFDEAVGVIVVGGGGVGVLRWGWGRESPLGEALGSGGGRGEGGGFTLEAWRGVRKRWGGAGGAENGLGAVAEEATREELGFEFWLLMGFHGGSFWKR